MRKEKKENKVYLTELEEEFNPSARDPYLYKRVRKKLKEEKEIEYNEESSC